MMENQSTEDLFCDLMDLPPDERSSALEAMENVSDESKSVIRRMLKEAEDADAYFSKSSVAVKMLPMHSQVGGEGDMCGPYKLVRKLGEGGFGLVWLAEQEKPLKRIVAVKVIKAGMDTEEVLARFDAEKHALARMDHPNIAKVLDAGMTDMGRPYFVMELVEGKSITRYCQENNVALPERLRLFADVCSALHHAHQKGIIHRDIKPSNVIVTEIESKPVAKVIDFGIAKAIEGQLTEHTLRTRAEQWIGTPTYMSPEQAGLGAADVDTRSDIYGLGVLLYELITDEAPFDSITLMKAGYEEMRRIIREVEPAKPSVRMATTSRDAKRTDRAFAVRNHSTAKCISSELDWIVMKAIEKVRERRYESAAALADDVARHLADEPVVARPPTTLYLLSKFARRHRLWIHIASVFLVLVVGAVLLSVWLALRARDAEQVAQERLSDALQERNAKNQALEETESVSRLLADVLQRPRPGVDGRTVTVLEALDAATEKLEKQLEAQPQRRVALRGVLADTYERLHIFDRALQLREKNYKSIRGKSGTGHLSTRVALRDLIVTAEAVGDSELALKYALEESEILQNASAMPKDREAAMGSVIMGLVGTGDRKRAMEMQRDLVSHCRKEYGEDSTQEYKAKWELRQYEARGGVSEGHEENEHTARIDHAEKQYVSQREQSGARNESTIDARIGLAEALLHAGFSIEAQLHLQALLSITTELWGWKDDRTIRVQRALVRANTHISRHGEAIRIQQALVETMRAREGAHAESTVAEENKLERLLFYNGPGKEHRTYVADLSERRKMAAKSRPESKQTGNPEQPVSRKDDGDGVKPHITRGQAEQIVARARHNAATGKLQDAIKLYAECTPFMLDDTWANFECATFQLWMGDREGFQRTRNNIIKYWKESTRDQKTRTDMFDRAVWLCSIAPLDDDDQKSDVKHILDYVWKIRDGLLTEAVERHSKRTQFQIRAAVLYRLEMYQEALSSFDTASRLMNPNGSKPDAFDYQPPPSWICYFIAMTHYRLGNKDQAIKMFRLGESTIEGEEPSRENPVLNYFIGGETLTNWIVRSEAKELIFQ